MERQILKDMGKKWGTKPTSKELYLLFPLAPSKQGARIAGLPFVHAQRRTIAKGLTACG